MDKLKYFFSPRWSLGEAGNSFLDYLWPQFCLGCHKEGSLCCSQCFANLQLLPLDYQPWAEQKNFYFDHCYVCLNYSDKLTKGLIKNFKYTYLTNLEQQLSTILIQQISRLNISQAIITNVPLHSRKKRRRGFDQTSLLAQAVTKKFPWQYLPLLQRQKNTAPQAKLSKDEREKNVCNAFTINPELNTKINNQIIILIDDVVTTGSTLNEAAKVLRQYNPAQIIAIVLAKN